MFHQRPVFTYITTQNNLYAQQCGSAFSTTKEEIEKYTGILVKLGIVAFSRYRMFWASEFRCPPIADHMTRGKFFNLNKYIHFADNNDIVLDK